MGKRSFSLVYLDTKLNFKLGTSNFRGSTNTYCSIDVIPRVLTFDVYDFDMEEMKEPLERVIQLKVYDWCKSLGVESDAIVGVFEGEQIPI